jgi:RimJ/RimL family protein N-acetyltransferase
VSELLYPDPPLSDGEILLRAMAEADLSAVVNACRDPEIVRFTKVPDGYTETDARAWRELSERQRRQGSGIVFLVISAARGELAGSIDLHGVEWEELRAKIGYWTAAEARDQGVATRAVRLLSRWALEDLGLARLEIDADVENIASQSVAEGAGFTREGVLRSHSQVKDRRYDSVVFSLLPGDLENGDD